MTSTLIGAERAVEIRWQLKMLERGVRCFGSALDAADRGGGFACERLEREGHECIAAAFVRAPELKILMPRLWSLVECQQPLQEKGFDISKQVRAARRKLARLIASQHPSCD